MFDNSPVCLSLDVVFRPPRDCPSAGVARSTYLPTYLPPVSLLPPSYLLIYLHTCPPIHLRGHTYTPIHLSTYPPSSLPTFLPSSLPPSLPLSFLCPSFLIYLPPTYPPNYLLTYIYNIGFLSVYLVCERVHILNIFAKHLLFIDFDRTVYVPLSIFNLH